MMPTARRALSAYHTPTAAAMTLRFRDVAPNAETIYSSLLSAFRDSLSGMRYNAANY
jgi:hypothetical protein